jgi:hypothetical protein
MSFEPIGSVLPQISQILKQPVKDCQIELQDKLQKVVDEKYEDEKLMMACMVCKNVVMNPL